MAAFVAPVPLSTQCTERAGTVGSRSVQTDLACAQRAGAVGSVDISQRVQRAQHARSTAPGARRAFFGAAIASSPFAARAWTGGFSAVEIYAAASASFDVVSTVDIQELKNALTQSEKEIKGRFDLKDTKTSIDLKDDKEIVVETASQLTLDSVVDLIKTKASKRGLSLKVFEAGEVEKAGGERVRQKIKLVQGIDKENAKKIQAAIREEFKKVTSSIQGEAVRVSSKSKDELQMVMTRLKTLDLPVAIQFENFR